MVKNLSPRARDKRDVGSVPGLGGSLDWEIAPCSSTLAWKIPWAEEPSWAIVYGAIKSWT